MARYGRKNFEPVGSARSPRMGDLTVGDYANGMPNIRLGEMFKSLMRQLFWIIPALLVGIVVAGILTKDLKRIYTGDGRIMVQLGEEYVYNPVGQAANGNGLTTTIDTITLTEAALMKNSTVLEAVIGQMAPPLDASGQNRTNSPEQNLFDKAAFTKINKATNERDRQDAIMELRRSVEESYTVAPRAKSSIIDVSYKHENPAIAVATTNAFIDEYMSFRRQVFVEGSSELITERREATEEQLNANERAIASFLKRNGIADFESEQTGLRERTEDLKAAVNTTRTEIAATEAALAQVEDTLRDTPETINLYVDDRARQRVAQAELELRQLMAKYLPTSDPVKQKQTELSELRALQASYGGKASGGRRVGPNPTHQGLTTRRNTLAATADSLREREFTQQRQLNSADAKIRKLTSLTPEYQNLLRERVTLETRLTSYNSKEQEALVDAQQQEAKAENVKVISRADYANKGRNMRKLAWAGATAAWGFVLFFFAMIKVFLDPNLYAVPAAVRSMPEIEPIVDLEPRYAPIPEPIPEYQPRPPASPNPYEAQPAAYAEPESYGSQGHAVGAYDPNQYVHYSATGDVYAPQPMTGEMTASAAQYPSMTDAPPPYQQGNAEPLTYPEGFSGNAAVNLDHNPYASGEVQAGSLDAGLSDGQGATTPEPYIPPQS